MALYRNEKAFKNDLMRALRVQGAFVTPIQTRTVPGVPDLYVASKHGLRWIECKIIHANFDKWTAMKQIPFRTGQIAWAYHHYLFSQKEVICAIAFDDCLKYFYMNDFFEGSHIARPQFTDLQLDILTNIL